MKYIVILGDGMADLPIDELGGKTPLEVAHKPNMDYLAKKGEMGLVHTVPKGFPPGSDVANLAVFGYDPKIYYTGRSPLEAVSMGVELRADDMAFRTNLVTLSDDENYEEKIMIDYSSDEISTEEAEILINAVNEVLKTEECEFFRGISYRHLMVWHKQDRDFVLTPPHDITDRKITEYLPSDEVILGFMKKSYDILKNHPVNKNRISRGLKPANSIWIWGNGKKPALSSFYDKYKVTGSTISAVDLIKGIGICAGLRVIDVEGATGNVHTNFDGKAAAAIDALKGGDDFIYLHIEAPDEAGHRYELDNKIKAIELIDKKIVEPICGAMETEGIDYAMLIMPDHPTPLELRTHTSDPVPFIIYRSNSNIGNNENHERNELIYSESCAKESGIEIKNGYEIMDKLIN